MSTEIQIQTEQIIAPIRRELIQISGDEKAVFRLEQSLSIAILEEPKLLNCTPESLQREIRKCCADGLVPDGKEAALIPYNAKNGGVKSANYQPMVYGVMKRMRELGAVHKIVVDLVYENDHFRVDRSNPEVTEHWEKDAFSNDRGELKGGYCIFRDKNDVVIHRELMSKDELVKIKDASKKQMGGKISPAWGNWETQMYKKAIIRRASNFVTLNNSSLRDMIERIDSEFDFNSKHEPVRSNPFKNNVVDHSPHPSNALPSPTNDKTDDPEALTAKEKTDLYDFQKDQFQQKDWEAAKLSAERWKTNVFKDCREIVSTAANGVMKSLGAVLRGEQSIETAEEYFKEVFGS